MPDHPLHRAPRWWKQTNITDYLERPRRGIPISVVKGHAPQQPPAKEHTERPPRHRFTTILDLPNELLLVILDELRHYDGVTSHSPVSLMLPNKSRDYRQERFLDPARRLYAVCKRFYNIFSPFIFESIVCTSFAAIRRLRLQPRMESIRQINVRLHKFPQNWSPHRFRLPSCLSSLTGLTTVTVGHIILDISAFFILGRLKNLTHLVYDMALPPPLWLSRCNSFCRFRPSDLEDKEHLLPCALIHFHVQFSSHRLASVTFPIIASIIKASSKTLEVLTIDFCAVEIWKGISLDSIFLSYLPSLSQFELYHVDIDWNLVQPFISRHSSHLKKLHILIQNKRGLLWYFRRVGQLPGLDLVSSNVAQRPVGDYSFLMERDPTGQISASEVMLVDTGWELLRHVGDMHPYLRVMHLWNANRSTNKYRSAMKELMKASMSLPYLEVLRFNTGQEGLDGSILVNESPYFCDPEGRILRYCECEACARGVYDIEGREKIQEEWEEFAWITYEPTVRKLVKIFPKLLEVEWVLTESVWGWEYNFLPSWRWDITRTLTGNGEGAYTLRRTLIGLPELHPLRPCSVWTATRGLYHGDGIRTVEGH